MLAALLVTTVAVGPSLTGRATTAVPARAAVSRRAALLLPLVAVRAAPAHADALTDSFELSTCYSSISQGLERWNAEVALTPLGQEGKLAKSTQQLSEGAVKRIGEAGGEAGKAAAVSYKKHSAAVTTNLYLAKGATKYETAAVAAQYFDAAKAEAQAALGDLQVLGAQVGVRLEAPASAGS